jgi:hypothetical protein
MVAIWPDRTADTRRRVLLALLEMRDAVDQFNLTSAGKPAQDAFRRSTGGAWR